MTEKNETEDSMLFSISLDADLLDEDYDVFLMKEMLDFLRWTDINDHPNAIQLTLPTIKEYIDECISSDISKQGFFMHSGSIVNKAGKTWTS